MIVLHARETKRAACPCSRGRCSRRTVHRQRAARCPARCRNATLGARGASPREVAHAERRWRMHGGNKTPPRRGSAAAHRGRHASCGWSEGGSQLLLQAAAAVSRRAATPPLPATDPEHSEPGGAGVRGRGALSGGSTRGARGAGAEPSGAKGWGGRILQGATKVFHFLMEATQLVSECSKQKE